MHDKKEGSIEAKHVAIEMNPLLHTNMRLASDPKHFMSKIFCSLDKLLTVIKPTESLILVFDGPAPFAKMQTQRSRRSLSPDNSLLTPGTYFMDTMEDAMVCYVAQRLKRPPLSENITVYISGARSPGEGELKIVNWVHNIMPDYNDTMVICGSDSDLLVQALSFPRINNLRVLQNGIDKVHYVCDIHHLSCEILADADFRGENSAANFEYNLKVSSSSMKRRDEKYFDHIKHLEELDRATRIDFVLLFILNGNDYLPRLRGGGTFAKILMVYSKVTRSPDGDERKRKHIIDLDSSTFNFPVMYEFFKEMAAEEIFVPSPAQIVPTCTEQFLEFLQRHNPDLELDWRMEVTHVDGLNLWSGCLEYMGRNYTNEKQHQSKKAARNELSMLILKDRHPEEYDSFLRKKKNKMDALDKRKAQIVGETNERVEQVRSLRDTLMKRANLARRRGDIYRLNVYSSMENNDSSNNEDNEDLAHSSSCDDFNEDNSEEASICNDTASLIREGRSDQYDGSNNEKYKGRNDFNETVYVPSENLMKSDYFYVNDDPTKSEKYEFVRDRDVEEYLRGLLWIVRMYADGICPDISYSFMSRTAPAPSRIIRYVHTHMDDVLLNRFNPEEGSTITYIQETISAPFSTLGSLSSEATSSCVIPQEGAAFISPGMKGVWLSMQTSLSSEEGLRDLCYADVVNIIKKAWETPPPQPTPSAHRDKRQKSLRLKNQKRVPRGVRRDRGREKFAARFNHIGKEVQNDDEEITLSDFYNDETFQSEMLQKTAKLRAPQVMAPEEDNRWTVIKNDGDYGVKRRRDNKNREMYRKSRKKTLISSNISSTINSSTFATDDVEQREDSRFYVKGKVWGNKMRYRTKYSLPKPFKAPNLPNDCLFSISTKNFNATK